MAVNRTNKVLWRYRELARKWRGVTTALFVSLYRLLFPCGKSSIIVIGANQSFNGSNLCLIFRASLSCQVAQRCIPIPSKLDATKTSEKAVKRWEQEWVGCKWHTCFCCLLCFLLVRICHPKRAVFETLLKMSFWDCLHFAAYPVRAKLVFYGLWGDDCMQN